MIETKGTLAVNCGSFSTYAVKVYNEDTEWAPQSIVGNTQYYNVYSEGAFTIRHVDGRVLLTFSVIIPQDFILYQYINHDISNPLVPGGVLTEYTYRQLASRSRGVDFLSWVRSEGTPIVGLQLTATNNAVPSVLEKNPNYGDDYLHFTVDLSRCTIGQPLEVFVGNVLVIYVNEITA